MQLQDTEALQLRDKMLKATEAKFEEMRKTRKEDMSRWLKLSLFQKNLYSNWYYFSGYGKQPFCWEELPRADDPIQNVENIPTEAEDPAIPDLALELLDMDEYVPVPDPAEDPVDLDQLMQDALEVMEAVASSCGEPPTKRKKFDSG